MAPPSPAPGATRSGRPGTRQTRLPLDPACPCRVCARFSRGYIRHLLVVSEPTGGRLLTIHNLSWLLALVARARDAIRSQTLAALRAEVAALWEPGSLR